MGFEKINFGIDILDEALPEGIPRTSFIMFSGHEGSGKTILTILIAKQFLLRKEPVIYVVFDDDPNSLTNFLQSQGVEVYSYISERLLLVVDGFSFRIKDKKGRMHIAVLEDVDPMNPEQVLHTIIQLIDRFEIRNRGILIIDSLNEFLSYHGYAKVGEFVKNIRANISKYRGILTIAVLHTSSKKAKRFKSFVAHVVDGLIQIDKMCKDNEVLRYVIVKRMKGVRHRTEKVLFNITQHGVEKVV
jgi:KaiC/GvpD/RAD55 family RecA-like ATPase